MDSANLSPPPALNWSTNNPQALSPPDLQPQSADRLNGQPSNLTDLLNQPSSRVIHLQGSRTSVLSDSIIQTPVVHASSPVWLFAGLAVLVVAFVALLSYGLFRSPQS